MNDFWISCGHHLLDRNDSGGLVVTDEFLKAYFARPELMPPPDAYAAERALHTKLMASPRASVTAGELEALADEDARDNWRVMLAFRALLLEAPTLEAAYLQIVHGKAPPKHCEELAQGRPLPFLPHLRGWLPP